MQKYEYASILKDEMTGFLKMRESQGFKVTSRHVLISLDKHLVSHNETDKSLTARIIDAWLADTCKGKSTKSIHCYISYYNSFAKYLSMLGIEVFTPDSVRVHESYVPYIFSETEIDNIFIAADDIEMNNYRNTVTSQIQFAVLLRLLYGCGLRLGEALSLKKSDIDNTNRVLFIRGAKGNQDRFVPMTPDIATVLTQYSDGLLCDKPADARVFERNKNRRDTGKPRSGKWAHLKFRKVLSKAGIDLPELPPGQRNICLHCLRHTFIVRSFRKQDLAGVDNYNPAASLSVYAGHLNLNGTQRYLHMTAENSIDIINATNEYSKGMFPPVPNETDTVDENKMTAIKKPPEIMINYCSKGMFPEVPR
jgi:integrase